MSDNGIEKIKIYDLDGTEKGDVEVPSFFYTHVRADLIRLAVNIMEGNRRVPYGPNKMSGMRHSVEWSGKGKGVSRTPRLMDSMRGAQAPNTVSGREAHPPKPEKIYSRKINKKMLHAALRSALSATAKVDMIKGRGHILGKELTFPVVVEDSIESVNSSKEAKKVLDSLGMWNDVLKSKKSKKERSGKGKLRGRRLKRRRSVLIILESADKAKGFGNFEGVDIKTVKEVNVMDLAPGGVPGRLTIFSRNAFKMIGEVRKI